MHKIGQQSCSYDEWRAWKLAKAGEISPEPIALGALDNLSQHEKSSIVARCRTDNLALYSVRNADSDESGTREGLRAFAGALGLKIAERHRSAGNDGIVALRVSDAPNQSDFIPYSRRPMNWHTDGYYNAPSDRIRAMALHCAVPADDGGVNQFYDPEIAYIRLWDENPAYVKALSHPEAMVIPESRETGGNIRPVSTGPVFARDPKTGRLDMRFTSRTKSIAWRDDPVLHRAVVFLGELLASDDTGVRTIKMQAGQGIICNNVLHNRTGFDQDQSENSRRLMFRIRFHNRVPEE